MYACNLQKRNLIFQHVEIHQTESVSFRQYAINKRNEVQRSALWWWDPLIERPTCSTRLLKLVHDMLSHIVFHQDKHMHQIKKHHIHAGLLKRSHVCQNAHGKPEESLRRREEEIYSSTRQLTYSVVAHLPLNSIYEKWLIESTVLIFFSCSSTTLNVALSLIVKTSTQRTRKAGTKCNPETVIWNFRLLWSPGEMH